MKNVLKLLATFLIIIFIASCDRQKSINIFDEKIEINVPPQFSGHDLRFLEVTGLSNLGYIAVDGVSNSVLSKMSLILLPNQGSTVHSDNIVFIYIYTTSSDNQVVSIARSDVHAFSIVSTKKSGMNHVFYEKQPDGLFSQVLSIPELLNGPLNMDEIRMLHFASIGESQLPEKSSIFEFRSENFNDQKYTGSPNKTLMKSLLLDAERSKGSRTIGLYGDALYSALRADDQPGTGGNCGNAQLCPPGGNGSCVPSDIAGYVCQTGGGGGGGCLSAQLPALSQIMDIGLSTPIDFRSILSFRDNFLANTNVGKKYISYMYVFSQFAKLDKESLLKYASIIRPLQTSINTITSTNKTDIVVTEELRKQVMEIINAHKDVPDKDFQNILSRMELDIDRLAGLNKHDFVREFKSVTSAVY